MPPSPRLGVTSSWPIRVQGRFLELDEIATIPGTAVRQQIVLACQPLRRPQVIAPAKHFAVAGVKGERFLDSLERRVKGSFFDAFSGVVETTPDDIGFPLIRVHSGRLWFQFLNRSTTH